MNNKVDNSRLNRDGKQSDLPVVPLAVLMAAASVTERAQIVFYIQSCGPNPPRVSVAPMACTLSPSALTRWCYGHGVFFPFDERARVFREVANLKQAVPQLHTANDLEELLTRARAIIWEVLQ